MVHSIFFAGFTPFQDKYSFQDCWLPHWCALNAIMHIECIYHSCYICTIAQKWALLRKIKFIRHANVINIVIIVSCIFTLWPNSDKIFAIILNFWLSLEKLGNLTYLQLHLTMKLLNSDRLLTLTVIGGRYNEFIIHHSLIPLFSCHNKVLRH